MKKILLVDTGLPYDMNTLKEKPLGGAETSLFLLGQALAYQGESVAILNTAGIFQRHEYLPFVISPLNEYNHYINETEIVICNRSIPEFIYKNASSKQIFLYCHDAYDQPAPQWFAANSKIFSLFKNIFMVSEWQKKTFRDYLNFPEDKMIVIGNPIDPTFHEGFSKRNENRLIFASIPYKGLEALPDIFLQVSLQTKKEIELHVYSSMGLYNRPEEDKEYEKIFRTLISMKGVTLFKPVDYRTLAKRMTEASFYVHPCLYHETFGMALVQAQAAGVIPICMNNGAVNEVVINNETGYIIDHTTILSKQGFTLFTDKLSEAICADSKSFFRMRTKAIKFSHEFWNTKIAAKCSKYF